MTSPTRNCDPDELPSDAQLRGLAQRITSCLGFLDVTIAASDSPLPWSCAEVLTAQAVGGDPTAGWRTVVTANQLTTYADAPDRVAAAFVMQWYLGVVANPLAFAAVLSPWVLSAEPSTLRFDLSDGEGYPVAVASSGADVVVVAEQFQRLDIARRRYLDHAHDFIAGYRPPVRFGSRQRLGMIDDVWTMAVESALDSQNDPGWGWSGDRSWRASCCFIFALPGAQPCARCPRLRARLRVQDESPKSSIKSP